MYEKHKEDFNCFHVLNLNPFETDAYSEEDIIERISECREKWERCFRSRNSEAEDKISARIRIDSIDIIEHRMTDLELRKIEASEAVKLVTKMAMSLVSDSVVTPDGVIHVFPDSVRNLLDNAEWDSVEVSDLLSCANLSESSPELPVSGVMIRTVNHIRQCGMSLPSEFLNMITDDINDLSKYRLKDGFDKESFLETLNACKKKLSLVQDSNYPMRDVYFRTVNAISSSEKSRNESVDLEKLCKAWEVADCIVGTISAEKHLRVLGSTYMHDLIGCFTDQTDDYGLVQSIVLFLCYNDHIPVDMTSDDVNSVRCPSCLALINKSKTSKCPVCGAVLKHPCPKCGCLLPPRERHCHQCHCDIDYSELRLSEKYDEIEHLLESGKIHSALMAFQSIGNKYPYSETVSGISELINKYKSERDKKSEHAMKSYNSGRFFDAHEKLTCFISEYPEDGSDYKGYLTDCKMHIAESDRLCAESDEYQGDHRLSILLNASSVCTDNPRVVSRLEKYPPAEPQSITAESCSGSIVLRIIPPAGNRMTVFRVYRENILTGEKSFVYDVDSAVCEDRMTEPGAPFRYEAFSVRGGIRSIRSATSDAAIRLSEPGNPKSEEKDGGITISFVKAPNSCKTLIRRELNTGITDFFTETECFTDPTLSPGEHVTYTLKSVYRLNGKEVLSDGIMIACAMKPYIPEVNNLHISRCIDGYKAKWDCEADVVLYVSVKSDRRYLGVRPISEFDRTMKRITPTHILSKGMIFKTDEEGEFEIVPVSVSGNTGREGVAVFMINVSPFKNVTIREVEKTCIIKMDWPKDASEARISWSVNGTEYTEIKKSSDYTPDGFVFSAETEGWVEFRICAIYRSYGKSLTSNPVVLRCFLGTRKLIRYSIVENRFWKGITVSSDSVTSIPPLIAVGLTNGLPLTPHEGRVVWESKMLTLRNNKISFTVPQTSSSEKVRLFFRNNTDYEQYSLVYDNGSDRA